MKPIERAAEALHNHIHHDCEYAVVGIFAQKLWQDRARAVLMALREPFEHFDEPVAVAGGEIIGVGQSKPLHWSNCHQAKMVWQAMIDAALGDSVDNPNK
jgi:hypothetical protein